MASLGLTKSSTDCEISFHPQPVHVSCPAGRGDDVAVTHKLVGSLPSLGPHKGCTEIVTYSIVFFKIQDYLLSHHLLERPAKLPVNCDSVYAVTGRTLILVGPSNEAWIPNDPIISGLL